MYVYLYECDRTNSETIQQSLIVCRDERAHH